MNKTSLIKNSQNENIITPKKRLDKDYKMISLRIVKRFNNRNRIKTRIFLIQKMHEEKRCKKKHSMKKSIKKICYNSKI